MFVSYSKVFTVPVVEILEIADEVEVAKVVF